MDPATATPAVNETRKTWRVGTLTYTKAGLVTLFCWLLWGDFGWSMRDRAVGPVVQLLLKKFGASDTIMALFLSSLPAAMHMLLGPIISYRSDRHRGPRGRRMPYILLTTPVAALAMVGLAYSQELGGHKTATTLIVFGVFWTLFEFAAITSGAVFGGLINDVVPQSLLGRFYGLFRVLSLTAGIIFNYWLIGHAETQYKWLFIGIAAIYGIGVMSMCFKVKEGEYPAPPDTNRLGFIAKVKVYFRECYSKPYYLWIFFASATAGLCFLPVNLFSVPFAQSIGVDMTLYGKFLAITYVISLSIAYFLGSLADRFHPLRVGIVAMALYAITMLVGGFLPATPPVFAVVLIVHGVASGTYMTATASLGQRLYPRSTFTQFASASGLLGSITGMTISPLFGGFLDYTNHQYRYTFMMAGILSTLAVLLWWVVHKHFVALGGLKNYIAPE